MKKAAFHNLGCKVNAYETEAMKQLLEQRGYEIVPFAKGADVYVINTCTVTNIADRKSRQMLSRARKWNPEGVVVAAGCYVQEEGEKLKEEEGIDILIGNNQKGKLPELLDEYFAHKKKQQAVTDIGAQKEYEPLFVGHTGEHTRAFMKIQDGCNQFCSYCAIPYARGRVRSRELPQIMKEASALIKAGYRELVLTGIHLSSYGTDLEEGEDLLTVVSALSGMEGLSRIRLGSLEPGFVTERFVEGLKACPEICPHFHLSLQSGCDATLKRMNRRYTTKEYEEKCRLLRQYFPQGAITTDVICGFPGETEEEFARTKEFVEEISFYEMHVFPYSRRKGTRAADMPGQVPASVKKERSAQLLAISASHSQEFRRKFLGKRLEILLEETALIEGKTYYTGYTREYVKCAVEKGEKNQLVFAKANTLLPGGLLLCGENLEK